jgi:ATP-dependent Clp protease protease subunit
MKKLFQLMEANRSRGPGLRAETLGTEASLYLYDVIGYCGCEATDFVTLLAGIKAETIHLHINSPGGDVFEAVAIKQALMAHPARIIVHIDGVAASAATIVMTAADEIQIAPEAFIMIHKCWAMAGGNADELRSQADLQDKVDEVLASVFVTRTGQALDQVLQWMLAETWFSAAEAVDFKFADKIAVATSPNPQLPPDPVDPMPEARLTQPLARAVRFDLSSYHNVPAALTAGPHPAPSPDPVSALNQMHHHQLARLALYERMA